MTSKKNSQEYSVHLEGVRVARAENDLIHDVNSRLGYNEFAYVSGPVGGGKSSLLELLYGELPHVEGEAHVLGHNLKKLKRNARQALRRRMGIVFQSSDQLLYDRTVADNLDFVLRATGKYAHRDRQQRIEEALTKVGMQGKGYKMPHELSGGEAERICIARAIIVNPELILMDEPTAGLDPDTARSIGQLIQQISKEGTAVLMATHNQELMRDLPAPIYKIEPKTRTLELIFPEGMGPEAPNAPVE